MNKRQEKHVVKDVRNVHRTVAGTLLTRKTPRDQRDLNKSLRDAQKISRRLSRSIVTLKGHFAARDLCNVLRRLGAKDEEHSFPPSPNSRLRRI